MPDELSRRRGPWLPSVHRALVQGVDAGVFPGAACAVYRHGELVHGSATGLARPGAPATVDTLYDLASLTKVLATTCAVAVLVGQGRLALGELVRKRLPAFARGGKARITVRDLLAHRSGLPAWRPYFALAQADPGAAPLFSGAPTPSSARRSRAVVSAAAIAEPPERGIGEAAVYSDVGFMVLGLLLEACAGARLHALCDALIYRPLGLRTLHFRPLGVRALPRFESFAVTGAARPRPPAPGQEGLFTPGPDAAPVRGQPPNLGEVDDDNAFAMGGVSGHAGLFGTADEVARLGASILDELGGAARLAPPEVWTALCARDDRTPGSTRALGFDTPSAEGSSLGGKLGRGPLGAVGHLGFTGTSLWLDRDRQLAVALCTNRVFPDRSNERIRAFRPRFHDAVADALDG